MATPDTEAAWVERAAGVTSRVLEAEVATVELKCEVVGPESGQARRVIEVTYGDGRRSRTGG